MLYLRLKFGVVEKSEMGKNEIEVTAENNNNNNNTTAVAVVEW